LARRWRIWIRGWMRLGRCSRGQRRRG
jgi:hypothetical protein